MPADGVDPSVLDQIAGLRRGLASRTRPDPAAWARLAHAVSRPTDET